MWLDVLILEETAVKVLILLIIGILADFWVAKYLTSLEFKQTKIYST